MQVSRGEKSLYLTSGTGWGGSRDAYPGKTHLLHDDAVATGGFTSTIPVIIAIALNDRLRPERPTMQKWMCLGAVGVAGLALLLCLLDLFTGSPFGGGPYVLADIGGLIASGILIYMGLNAYKDVK